MKSISLIAACAVVLIACDNVESTEVLTEDMRLFMDVRVDSEATAEMLVQITTDNPALLEETFVNLAAGDELLASVGDVTLRMVEEQIVPLGIYQYVTDFADVAGEETITVSLERPRQVQAPNSFVVVPGAFDLDDPGVDFSRADGLVLTWSTGAVADAAHVRINGDCIDQVAVDFDGNPGGVDLDALDFVVSQGMVANVECVVTVDVSLENDGAEDPAYGRGGNVHAYQVRSLELTTKQ